MAEWITRWGTLVRVPAVAPGIMVRQGGGFLIHAKVRGKTRQRVVLEGSIRDAQRERQALIDEAHAPTLTPSSRPLFASYATSIFKRKVEQGDWKSAATREEWKRIIEKVLIPGRPAEGVPGFGRLPVDAITRELVESWKSAVAKRFGATLSPVTANTWLRKLLQLLRDATAEFNLDRDPTLRVSLFNETDVALEEDNPNSLTVDQAARFLAEMRRAFPQFYAMTLLGFVTGLRPSSLRPLRRRGEESDIDWSNGVLRVRRSNSRRQEIMRGTKQRTRYTIGLPKPVMLALDEHVASLDGARASDECALLFPSRGSKRGEGAWMVSRSVLDKPFRAVSESLKLPFALTAKGMRRTFQDLCRATGVSTELQQAICGHSGRSSKDDDAKMTRLYSTYRPDETRTAISKVVAAILPAAKRRNPAA